MKNRVTDSEQIDDFLSALFANVSWAEGDFVCFRGLPEKGSPAQGAPEEFFFEPSKEDYIAEAKILAERFEDKFYGFYVVPAVLSGRSGKKANVKLSPAVIVDIDSGKISEKFDHLKDGLGPPSMVVKSGGKTEAGEAKVHAYWVLTDPEDSTKQMESLRSAISDKGGTDRALVTVQQLIRVAGSCHGKFGEKNLCDLASVTFGNYEIGMLEWQSETMDVGPGGRCAMGGQMSFNPQSGVGSPDTSSALVSTVNAGGETTNRWTEFTRVAGHYIHTARQGDMTVEEARERAFGWAHSHMVPCWPQEQLERQFDGLLRKDVSDSGEIIPKISFKEAMDVTNEDLGLARWAPHRWMLKEKPKRKFIVEGLIMEGKPHLLAADGGVGKTFLLLDLCLKVAAAGHIPGQQWCGHDVVEGGSTILITNEDDQNELNIRLIDIDPDQLTKKIGDDMMVVPTVDSLGSFQLCSSDGSSSPAWNDFMELLKKQHAKKPIKLVCIDTLASSFHGDENSSQSAKEYMAQVARIKLEIGAAVVISHHVRKKGQMQGPVKNLEEMREAVRGSSALIGSFRVVLGAWACPDWKKRMSGMKMEPKKASLYHFGVCKANNPEMLDGYLTLARESSGMLIDVTAKDVLNTSIMDDNKIAALFEDQAWLLHAIKVAARDGYPYTSQSKTAANGLFKRANELPPKAQMGFRRMEQIRDELVKTGKLVLCAAKGSKSRVYLDAPDGKMATDSVGMELASGAYEPPVWADYAYDYQSKQVLHAPADHRGQMGMFRGGV